MIISPPFLPAQTAGQTDEAWVNAAMPATGRLPETGAPEGSFPLSHLLMWHNGVHIQAPVGDGSHLPVRAIADGTVVFAKGPSTPPNTNVDDPQNYNPFDRQGSKTAAWTDNGCVIIEHRTSIGAEGTTETEIVFYSLYMHLSALGKITPAGQSTRRVLAPGDAIWRKDEVGTPGSVYGHSGQIHFEVCFDAANLHRLIGRAPSWVEPAVAPATLPAPTADGRTDSIFGSLYLYLPASTPTDAGAAMPTNHLRRATGAAGSTLGAPVWVKMTYERGDCTFETFDVRGARVGARPADADAEYELYTQATSRHNALPESEQANSSPSGWYELLRFGRNIGRGPAATEKDPLPANAAHWRRIVDAAGRSVWADLNAAGSFKFSDADFLPVMGWNFIDDDTNPSDQRCDSVNLKNLIRDPEPTNSVRMEPDQLARQLGNDTVQTKLRRVFCKFPSEWDKGSIATRYAFVKELDAFKKSPEAWPRLEAHLNALSLEESPGGYMAADWRMHPIEFMVQMRKCLWLSERELIQMVPLRAVRGQGAGLRGPFFYERIGRSGGSLIRNHHDALNRTWRKYVVTSRERLAAFIGNSVQETSWWSTTEEGNGPNLRYAPWFGRGFLQLTNPDGTFSASSNYGKYFQFRGRRVAGATAAEIEAWRNEVAIVEFDAADSSGAYWAWNRANEEAERAGTNVRRIVTLAPASQLFPGQAINIFENLQFRRVACLINLPAAIGSSNPQLNGLVDRYSGYAVAQIALLDAPTFPDSQGHLQFLPDLFLGRRA